MAQSSLPQPEWREHARQAMFQATVKEAQKRYGTDEPAFNYRWEHVLAVHALALKLARLTGADEEIVEAAAWLHDVRKSAGARHPQKGAAFARKFLSQTDFPPQKIEQVARAIKDHMGLWRKKPLKALESQVLWDADKLAKLGLTAAFHWLGMTLTKGEPASLLDHISNLRNAPWQEKTVASMHTAPAKRAAKQRLQAFNDLWDSLEGELSGSDLQTNHLPAEELESN